MFVYIYYKAYYYLWANQQSRTYTDRKKSQWNWSSSAESKYQIVKCRNRKTRLVPWLASRTLGNQNIHILVDNMQYVLFHVVLCTVYV